MEQRVELSKPQQQRNWYLAKKYDYEYEYKYESLLTVKYLLIELSKKLLNSDFTFTKQLCVKLGTP